MVLTENLSIALKNQFERELEIIKLIQRNPHPNIATYYKIIKESNRIIIVMELCTGGELSKHIKNGLELEKIKDYYTQILNGYLHLHDLHIIHRDIKSANILLTDDMKTIKLIDFGFSKIYKIDLCKTICGSPHYMAPELLYYKDYTSKSDIWSLGILLYEMIYGYTPFHKCKLIKSIKEDMDNIVFPEIRDINENIIEYVPNEIIVYMKNLLIVNENNRLDWYEIKKSKWLDNEDDVYNNDIFELELNNICKSKPINIFKKNNDINHTNSLPNSQSNSYDSPLNYGSFRGQSFGTIKYSNDNIKLDELSLMNNYFENEYEKIMEKHKNIATNSGLINIRDIDNRIIENISEKSTKYDYISESTCKFGKKLYSKSVPYATNVFNKFNKLGKVAKKTSKKIGDIIQ
jgi:serine/threonine protein kinase